MSAPQDATRSHVPDKDTQGEQEDSDTIHVQRPSAKNLAHIRTNSQISSAVSNSRASSTGCMANLSLASPSVGGSAHQDALTTLKPTYSPPVPERAMSSALRSLTAKAEKKGSSHNPIILEEYSPRRNSRTLTQSHGSDVEPHRFSKATQRKHGNRLIRPPLTTKPTNGSTFTGDKSNDIYRMRSAKFAAGGYGPQASPAVINFGVPFQVKYPRLAQHVAEQSSPATKQTQHQAQAVTQKTAAPSQRTAQQSQQKATTAKSMPPPPTSEDVLRRKAIQCIRDHSLRHQRRKPLSDDPDETSISESSASESDFIYRPPAAKRRKVTIYQDPNDHLTPLIAQSEILTSLLHKYSESKDRKGLREDITMLVSVQNERIEKWMKHEAKERKQRKSKDKASGVVAAKEKAVRAEKPKADVDREVRGLLSAGAGMWQDGSGEGLVDVYAAEERERSD